MVPLVFSGTVFGFLALAIGDAITLYGVQRHKSQITLEIYALLLQRLCVNIEKKSELILEQAKQVTALKDVFLATMSHEIRTPLNGIVGMLRMLQSSNLSEEQDDYLNVAKECSIQLLGIINDILDYSKMAAGKLVLAPRAVRVRKTIETAMDVVMLRAHEKNVDLTSYVDPLVPAVLLLDHTRVKQILVNLLSNAVKFTNEGSVRISTHLESRHPLVVQFEVRDTGIGIDKSEFKKIFKSFQQVSNPSHQSDGTGLGLAIVKKLVHLMHGKMRLRSRSGRGSSFSVSIPVKTGTLQETNEPTLAQFKGLSVLIVDDNTNNRMVLGNLLLQWGMRPQNCGSADEALMFIRSGYRFDVAFVDIKMPKMSGGVLCKRLRTMSDMPVIALSSLGSDDFKGRACFNAVLSKPVQTSKVMRALSRTLNQRPTSQTDNMITRPTPTMPPMHQARVLVVEDCLWNQKVALAFIKKLGYDHIDVASTGDEAVALATQTCHDVILMDLKLPGPNGFDVTKWVRQRWGSRVNIIAMTASVEEDVRDRCRVVGMDGFLSKPVKYEELGALLGVIEKRMVQQRRSDRTPAPPSL